MNRYIRLYLHFLRFSFSRAMEFRVDFFFRVVMDIFFYLVSLSFFKVIYMHTDSLGGWNETQVYVFISGLFLVDSLFMSIFASNMWWLPISVNKGDLDYHLVRPVSPLFILSFKEFAANSVMNIFAAIAISIWAIGNYAQTVPDFNFLNIFYFIFFLFVGLFIHWLLNLSFLIPVFWMHSNRGLGNLFYSIDQFSERPVQIFKGWFKLILLTIAPFGLVASVPATIFFEGPKMETAANMFGVLIFYSLFISWFWKKGLRSYSSASS